MHPMHSVIVLFVAFALTACAPTNWYKAGATQADLQKDSGACERDSRISTSSFGTGMGGGIGLQNFMERCMVAHGYTKQ
jgi:hypothetical protein